MKIKIMALCVLMLLSLSTCTGKEPLSQNSSIDEKIVVSSSPLDDSGAEGSNLDDDTEILVVEDNPNLDNENSVANVQSEDIPDSINSDVTPADTHVIAEIPQQMLEDMVKLSVMPQTFLDYASESGIETKTGELEWGTGKYTEHLYLRREDGAWRPIGAILDMTTDEAEIVYLHKYNAEGVPSSRDAKTGEFSDGYSIMGETVAVKFDSDNNISEIVFNTNRNVLDLAEVYRATMITIFEQY